MNTIKISDLPTGMIIWDNYKILGVTGCTLPKEYYDCYCIKAIGNNNLDFNLIQANMVEKV